MSRGDLTGERCARPITRKHLAFTSVLVLAAVANACSDAPPIDEERLRSAELPAGMSAAPLPGEYAGTALDGSPFHSRQLAGRIVLLDFWAVWCAPCIDAVPKLNAVAAEFADDPVDIVGYAVHSGSLDDVHAFAEEHGMEYRVIRGDDDVAYDFGVIGYPTYLLIDPSGRQVRKYVGALPELEARVIEDIRALLAAARS